jgi:hypothetical protein
MSELQLVLLNLIRLTCYTVPRMVFISNALSILARNRLESRHLVNICRRWGRDKTDDLQHAFFNGVGYVSWEDIWGIWLRQVKALWPERPANVSDDGNCLRIEPSRDASPIKPLH